jgi:hypothetical protein
MPLMLQKSGQTAHLSWAWNLLHHKHIKTGTQLVQKPGAEGTR